MEESVKCRKCGYLNPVTAKYCMNCGAKLIIESRRVSDAVVRITFIVFIIVMLDSLLNEGIITLYRNSLYALLGIITIILSAVSITTLALSFKSGLYVDSMKFRIIFFSMIIIMLVSIAYYITLLIAGLIIYSPIWLLTLYLIYHYAKVSRG